MITRGRRNYRNKHLVVLPEVWPDVDEARDTINVLLGADARAVPTVYDGLGMWYQAPYVKPEPGLRRVKVGANATLRDNTPRVDPVPPAPFQIPASYTCDRCGVPLDEIDGLPTFVDVWSRLIVHFSCGQCHAIFRLYRYVITMRA